MALKMKTILLLMPRERPAIKPDVIPSASAICRKFGRLELARFYACEVIPGSGDERCSEVLPL
jgi:hypothetical protein